MHLEKNRLDQIQNAPPPPPLAIGHYLLSHAQYLANRIGRVDHYYKTKCDV